MKAVDQQQVYSWKSLKKWIQLRGHYSQVEKRRLHLRFSAQKKVFHSQFVGANLFKFWPERLKIITDKSHEAKLQAEKFWDVAMFFFSKEK